jgi:transcriptional regulator with XRE-family HTH domain
VADTDPDDAAQREDRLLLDVDRIRRRRVELRLSQRTVAAAIGTASGVVVGIERGTNHRDLTIAQLARLADTLGLDVVDLFATPAPAADTTKADAAPDAGGDDAAVVGAMVELAGILTPITALAEAAGWTLQRANDALDVLEERLRSSGLRLHRQPGKVAIVRAVIGEDTDRIRTLVRTHLNRDGVSATEARMLRRIAAGTTPQNPSNPEAVALGVLANAGLIETADGGTGKAPVWVLADDVRHSLLLTP